MFKEVRHDLFGGKTSKEIIVCCSKRILTSKAVSESAFSHHKTAVCGFSHSVAGKGMKKVHVKPAATTVSYCG